MVFTSFIRRMAVGASCALAVCVGLVVANYAIAEDEAAPPTTSSKPTTTRKSAPVQPIPDLDSLLSKPKKKSAPAPKKKTASVPKSSTKSKKDKPPKLFGTIEFKGKLKNLPKWTSVLNKMKAWNGYFNDPSMDKISSKSGWRKLQKETAPMDEMGKLKAVNKFFNQWPYRLDAGNFGKSDYWATPLEFLKRSGDCEDYSIAKFYALKEMGFTQDRMRIVALMDGIRNIGHAVLVVYLGNEVYVLDNQTNMVLPHMRYRHYIPQYSVNEQYRWMHVPPTKKTTFTRQSQTKPKK